MGLPDECDPDRLLSGDDPALIDNEPRRDWKRPTILPMEGLADRFRSLDAMSGGAQECANERRTAARSPRNLSLKIGSVTCVVLSVLAFSSIVCGEMATSEAPRASTNGRTSSIALKLRLQPGHQLPL